MRGNWQRHAVLWVEVTRHLHFVDETPRYRAPERKGKVTEVVLIRLKTK